MLTGKPFFGLLPQHYASFRTEDARFSPSGRLLVLAPKQGLIVLEIIMEADSIRIGRHTELRSTSLAFPHGIEFLSEDLLVVANRDAAVTVHRLPHPDSWETIGEIEALLDFTTPWFGPIGATRLSEGREVRCGPGSVRKHGDQLYICANYNNTVSKHPFSVQDGHVQIGAGELVVATGLELIDGIAISQDGQWIALTDTGHGRVVVYHGHDHSLACELRDPRLGYPHGICFNPSGTLLYISDAGERLLHVFESADGNWERSNEHSSFAVESIEDEPFFRTKLAVGAQFQPLVGGIKGLELHPTGRFLVGTCLNQTLAFFETKASILWTLPLEPSLVLRQARSAAVRAC